MPEDDYYPAERKNRAKYFSTNTLIPLDCKPTILKVIIIGKMDNTYDTPISDTKANNAITRDIKNGNNTKGYYYINKWEDETSISAVVPNKSFLKIIKNHSNNNLNEDYSTNNYPPIPDILYHGQPPKYVNGKRIEPTKFSKFDQKEKRFLKDDNFGFYFTPRKKIAYDYAEGGNVYTCKVNIKNPYYYENIFTYNNKGIIKIATFIDEKDKENLINNGYDGVVLLDFSNQISEVIALYPEQIHIIDVLSEQILKKELEEEYPPSWNIEEFKKLNSFNQRVQYCNQHLQRISSGSSRIVYKVDDTKVLKLAKNKKGLAQNEVEIEYSLDYMWDDIVAKIFDYDQNNLWVEMELARKVTPKKFYEIVGFTFEDYCNGIRYHSDQQKHISIETSKPNNYEQMWEDNEFMYSIFDIIGSYDFTVGDLCRLNSYGLVNRNGQEDIVLIDYGLTNDVYDSYYK
jgi:hypothetical protein